MFFWLEVQSQRRTEAGNVQLLAKCPLRKVFVMTKHLKLKWEVGIEAANVQLLARRPSERSLWNDEALEVKVWSSHRTEPKHQRCFLVQYKFDISNEIVFVKEWVFVKLGTEAPKMLPGSIWVPKEQVFVKEQGWKNKSLWKNKASTTKWNKAWYTLVPSQLWSCDLPNRRINDRCHNLETHVALFSKITV